MKVKNLLEDRNRIDYDEAIHMRFEEVQKKVPYSKMFIHRLMREHKFPNLHITKEKKGVWIRKEIDAYIKGLENQNK